MEGPGLDTLLFNEEMEKLKEKLKLDFQKLKNDIEKVEVEAEKLLEKVKGLK